MGTAVQIGDEIVISNQLNNDNTTEVLHVMKSNNFLFNGEETIHLDNRKAFPSYQIVFMKY